MEQSGFAPAEERVRATTRQVVPVSIVRSTRGYIEIVVNQINGAYENGWFDACAEMTHRLRETPIIEAFEHHKIAERIRTPAGDCLYLGDLIDRCGSEPKWHLGRNCKRAMPGLNNVGDKSAPGRRYNAHRGDIPPMVADVPIVVQELVNLVTLK